MRRLAVGLLLLLLAVPASADGTKPQTVEQAADAVLVAAKAKDPAALKALAAKDVPDPWLVAEKLLERGQPEEAAAFAGAAPRKRTAALPAYVEAMRDQPRPTAQTIALEQVKAALREQELDSAVKLAAPHAAAPRRVLTLRIAFEGARALLRSGQREASFEAFYKVAADAEKLQWLDGASLAWRQGAILALEGQQYEAAERGLKAALAIAEHLDDALRRALTLANLANSYVRRSSYNEAQKAYERAISYFEEAGHEVRAATILLNMSSMHRRKGDLDAALRASKQAVLTLEKAGANRELAAALASCSSTLRTQGEYEAALTHANRSLAIHRALGDERRAAMVLGNIANIFLTLGDYAKALAAQKTALAAHRAAKNRRSEAIVLGNIGNTYMGMGNLTKALRAHGRALKLKRELKDRRGESITLGNMGVVEQKLGRHAAAMRRQEAALALARAVEDTLGEARSLSRLGGVYFSVGAHKKALGYFRQALLIREGRNAGSALPSSLREVGAALRVLGEHEEARTVLERSVALAQSMNMRADYAAGLAALASLDHVTGKYAAALARQQQVLAIYEELGMRASVAQTLGNIGMLHRSLGDLPQAIKALERSVRLARRLRAAPALVSALGSLARVRLAMDEPGRALETAQQALPYLEEILGGLGEETGATARTTYARLYGSGALAAARLDDPDALLGFIENGRAGSLLEALDGRQALQWTEIPEELRTAEQEAKAAYARARHAYARVQKRRKRRPIQAAAQVVDEAQARVREVAARIQREAKRAANLFYPNAATLDEVQAQLPAGTALVLYGLCLEEALALVLTQDSERIVFLGPEKDVTRACTALRLDAPQAEGDDGARALRRLVATPLTLDASVRRVIVSPEGALCYTPFGLLFPAREVTLTPSATTHVFLAEQTTARGLGVLAIGDALYGEHVDPGGASVYARGRGLMPLPATRAEALAIGDVTLLGADAGEVRLRAEIAKRPRWRAVHFACHGLIDAGRPTLSALALSAQGEEDGFLTCLEILRTPTPTDLAVLSACETARGQVVRGEGIVGLTRAFMFAGASRVICSLWKVDDEATQALMIRFYELWNPKGDTPGLGAAAALKQAQAFVRGQDKWKHPYYWAAWVLWGLPS